MSLAFELGPRVVDRPVSEAPRREGEQSRANLLREALLDLGRHGDRVGSVLALEIGLDPPEAVRDYLDTFDVGSLKVNYDPANLLVNGFDPVKGIIPLHRRIAHAHARDARRSTVSRGAQEVPLGAGDIDWLSYVGVAGGDRVSRLADDRTGDGRGSAQGRGARCGLPEADAGAGLIAAHAVEHGRAADGSMISLSPAPRSGRPPRPGRPTRRLRHVAFRPVDGLLGHVQQENEDVVGRPYLS